MIINKNNYRINNDKSEDRIKDKKEIKLNESGKEIFLQENKKSLEYKKNYYKIKVTQNGKKFNKENSFTNKENLENNKNNINKEIKENKKNEIKKENKENINVVIKESKENIIKKENKKDIIKKESKENIIKIEEKEDKLNKEKKENFDKKEYDKNKENKFIKKNKDNFEIMKNNENLKNEEKDFDEEIVKYFEISKINNVQIPKDYLNIIYYNLLKEEKEGIEPKADYHYMKNQKEINDKMRSILVDWIIDVHFKFGFTDETLFMTISIIDRYLTISQITRTNFQLLGITALMIATKHEEIDLPKIDDFIYITDNAYVKNDVVKMENDVLSKLNFSFLYPSPIKFFEYLSFHFNFTKKLHMMGKYLMETFLLDVKNVKYKPSIISCACAYIVMKFFKMSNYHDSYNKKFFNLDENSNEYSQSNIKECAKDICLLIDNINKLNYQACFKKYSKPEQEKVAIIIMKN